jgi:hypothetical protein
MSSAGRASHRRVAGGVEGLHLRDVGLRAQLPGDLVDALPCGRRGDVPRADHGDDAGVDLTPGARFEQVLGFHAVARRVLHAVRPQAVRNTGAEHASDHGPNYRDDQQMDELGNYDTESANFCSSRLRKSVSTCPPGTSIECPDVCDPYTPRPPRRQGASLPLRTNLRSRPRPSSDSCFPRLQ